MKERRQEAQKSYTRVVGSKVTRRQRATASENEVIRGPKDCDRGVVSEHGREHRR
jgi:hypothetical protein